MLSKTNEQAFEEHIEQSLLQNGFIQSASGDFDAQFAIDQKCFWQFLTTSQQDVLNRYIQFNPNDWQRKILERLDRAIKKDGILLLLKKGLKIDNIHLQLLYPLPLASSGETVRQNFAYNVFSVMRQVHYSQDNPREAIDMVLLINGLPMMTLELKNIWTGQTALFDGQQQYRQNRDPKQPLLQFGRTLVHLAVDTDEVYMTTKLAGKDTFFLPFNKGNNHGKGNPPNPNGFKTAYLWQEVFTPNSLVNIITHFVRYDGDDKTPLAKRTLFFPRYHQLEVVQTLLADVAQQGAGQTYLIQHSAGSGKSNSITWLAYQLIEVYQPNKDLPLFDSVIVVTDRRLLDKQLRDNIQQFAEVKNIIAPAHSSADLRQHLENGKKIIITTIQKFPFIVDGIADLSDKTFAVIIDEAHSSQSGNAHDNMNRAMGQTAHQENNEEEPESNQDKILKAMQKRKMRGNASYFAFTATPKNTTLEKFGQQQADGSFKPFHLYSMKQAIEEGFILDVLANYTTYKSYYKIAKSIEENPLFDKNKAQQRLRAFVEQDKRTITAKAEVMLEHFIQQVFNKKKLQGNAKAMVITQNIKSAIRYYQALKTKLAEYGNPFKLAIAFSGEKEVDGIQYTEAMLNGFSETDTRDKFDEDDYKILVVANKYLTGFDQPKLSTMYVDKTLAGVLCVQALSRLNRSAAKLGKKTEDLLVLDFFNEVKDIQTAFEPFYTATHLSEATDINVLHDLKDALDHCEIYKWQEAVDFTTLYFNHAQGEQLSKIVDRVACRFNEKLNLNDAQKADIKIKAKQFVKIYGQMAAIMPFDILEWEQLFWLLKFTIPKLKVLDKQANELDALLESVDLSSYGLVRTKVNETIALTENKGELAPQNPNPRGAHQSEKESEFLDNIVADFNLHFEGWDATPDETRVLLLQIARGISEHKDYQSKYADNTDPHTRDKAFALIFEEVMLKRRKGELALYQQLNSDTAFKSTLMHNMRALLNLPDLGI